MAYYFASKTRLKLGDKIRPHKAGHDKQDIEDVFERVRKESFSSRPPRVGSVFVCQSLGGFCRSGQSGVLARPYVYKVEVKGARKVFTANAEMWTEAAFYPKGAERYAESYWKREADPKNDWSETLVYGGTVRVTSEVTEGLVGAIDRLLLEAEEKWSVEGFFKRHPKLKKYAPKKVVFDEYGSGARSHPEASQKNDAIHLYPKFWDLAKYGVDQMDFVFAHEIGHFWSSPWSGWRIGKGLGEHARSQGIDIWDDLPYAQGNYDEAFADCFAAYFLNPSELKSRYPAWFKLVKSML